MSWINWLLNDWERIESFEVRYYLITESGNKIACVFEETEINKEIIGNYGHFKYNEIYKTIVHTYRKEIKKRAEEILNKYQIKQRKRLIMLILDSGKYIVACSFDVVGIKTKPLTYKEYKDFNKKHSKE